MKSAAASVQLQECAYTTLRPTRWAFSYDFANLLFQGLVLTLKKLKNGANANTLAVKSEDMYKQFAVPSVLATLSKLHLEFN